MTLMKIKRLFAFAVVLCLLIPVAKAENQENLNPQINTTT